jgi:hypothetical protein
MPKKWHIFWSLNFLVKKCHVLTLRNHNINKILILCILIINKFHHNNIIHHNRMLILITTRKSLPLVPDKVRLHICQVPNIILIQQLVLDFHRYIQRVRNVLYQHPTQAFRNHRSNPKMTREGEDPPTYDAPWWRYYEQILGPDGVLINARCKVSNCKTSYKKNLNLSHIGEEQCVISALKEMFNLYNTQLHANQTNQQSSSNFCNIMY